MWDCCEGVYVCESVECSVGFCIVVCDLVWCVVMSVGVFVCGLWWNV